MRLALVVLFLLNVGAILLNHGVLWDDWKIYNMSYDGIEEQTWAAGMYSQLAGAHYLLQQFADPPFVYRVVTVVTYALTALFGFLSIMRMGADRNLAVLAALLFVINPFYAARNTMVCLPYTVSLLLFMAGLYFFLTAKGGGNVVQRISSLVLFYLSFLTNSLLCLYAIVPILLIADPREANQSLVRRLISHLDFLLLPIVFWLVKVNWFPPHGLYDVFDHNQITMSGIVALPRALAAGTWQMIKSGGYLLTEHFNVLLFLIVAGITALLLRRVEPLEKSARPRRLLIAGVVLLVLGMAPYALVGKTPSFSTFESRHQLLVPLGFVSIVLALMARAGNLIGQRLVLIVTIALSTYLNLVQQYRYLVGWMKYEAVLTEFQHGQGFDGMSTIEVHDNTGKYNPTDQEILFFEWNGMAKSLDHRQDRLFIPGSFQAVIRREGSLDNVARHFRENRAIVSHNMESYEPDGTCHSLVVNLTSNNLDDGKTLAKLVFTHHIDRQAFEQMISDYVAVSVHNSCTILSTDNQTKQLLKR